MDNFDLRQYLAEGKLFEESKTLDVYGDGEIVVDLNNATPDQERLIKWEMEISEFETSEEAQEVANDIMSLNSEDDVETYYGEKRDWYSDKDLTPMVRLAIDTFRGIEE